MALSPRLELKTSQTLVMTPQLQQAIKLLQMSNLDLSQYVEQEVEKNPLLEWESGDSTDAAGDEAEESSRSVGGTQTADRSLTEDRDASAGPDAPLDIDYENVYEKDPVDVLGVKMNGAGVASGGSRYADAGNVLEQTMSESAGLRDHLTEQLIMSAAGPQERLIGQYLIDLINDSGYLTDSVENAADRLGASVDAVEEVLALIQTFDPAGVGARTVAECLALQLKERNRYDPAMATLLEHLDLVAKQELTELRKLCGVDREDLVDMLAEIRALNPKPGASFGGDPVQPIVPDVFVRPDSESGWQIELNSDTLPKVLVNSRYYAQIKDAAAGRKDDKAYLSDCLHSANWLVKALDQRARTILKVATEIVRHQDGFLRHGISHLKPLNLRMVAEAIGMHESTVSRVTANKYMSTSRGIFELKYFFSSAVGSDEDGDAFASEAVRHRIKELIDAEAPDKILSDDKLVSLLKASGINVARRTVAKYREAMGIPSSVQRRRMKRIS